MGTIIERTGLPEQCDHFDHLITENKENHLLLRPSRRANNHSVQTVTVGAEPYIGG